jgi:hypothetical protein
MIPIVIPETCACEENNWERRPGDGGTLIVCRTCGYIGLIAYETWERAMVDRQADLGMTDSVAAYLAEVRERSRWTLSGTQSFGHGASMQASAADVPRLLAAVEAVRALTRDTDGNYLPGESEVPVGEFQAALYEALLSEGGQ